VIYKRTVKPTYARRRVARQTGTLITTPMPRRPGGGTLRSMSSPTVQTSSSPSKEQSAYAHGMDITRFLSTYLSGEGNVWVTPQGDGFACQFPYLVAGKEYYRIRVPDWRQYDLPGLDEFSKYRIFRFGVGHESGHARHTPRKVYTHGKDDFDKLAHDVINVIEDRRIEDLLVEEFPGYAPERLFANGYAHAVRPSPAEIWEKARKWREEADKAEQERKAIEDSKLIDDIKREEYLDHLVRHLRGLADNAEKEARYEAFMSGLIAGKIKDIDKLPQKDRELIEEAIRAVEEELKRLKEHKNDHEAVYKALAKLTEETIAKLDLRSVDVPKRPEEPRKGKKDEKDEKDDRTNAPPGGPADKVTPEDFNSASSEWDKTWTEDQAEGKDAKDVEKGIEDYLDEQKRKAKSLSKGEEKKPGEITDEDVEQAKQGSQQARNEFQQAKRPNAEFDPALAVWSPVANTEPPEAYRDAAFISKMRENLKDWRTGRKDIISASGEYFSVPSYLATKGSSKPTPFIHRIKKSAKGRKIFFLLDFSASMKPREGDYKRALISTMEILDNIGVKTAVFGFGGEKEPDGNIRVGFFRVKRFEDPRWTRFHSGKLAALTASFPSTPTGHAYQAIEEYTKRHRPDAFVTITDGAPNVVEVETVKDKVRTFKKKTRMVAFGIGPPTMGSELREFGYHKVFSAEDVHEIPKKLVPMIAPEGTA